MSAGVAHVFVVSGSLWVAVVLAHGRKGNGVEHSRIPDAWNKKGRYGVSITSEWDGECMCVCVCVCMFVCKRERVGWSKGVSLDGFGMVRFFPHFASLLLH